MFGVCALPLRFSINTLDIQVITVNFSTTPQNVCDDQQKKIGKTAATRQARSALKTWSKWPPMNHGLKITSGTFWAEIIFPPADPVCNTCIRPKQQQRFKENASPMTFSSNYLIIMINEAKCAIQRCESSCSAHHRQNWRLSGRLDRSISSSGAAMITGDLATCTWPCSAAITISHPPTLIDLKKIRPHLNKNPKENRPNFQTACNINKHSKQTLEHE